MKRKNIRSHECWKSSIACMGYHLSVGLNRLFASSFGLLVPSRMSHTVLRTQRSSDRSGNFVLDVFIVAMHTMSSHRPRRRGSRLASYIVPLAVVPGVVPAVVALVLFAVDAGVCKAVFGTLAPVPPIATSVGVFGRPVGVFGRSIDVFGRLALAVAVTALPVFALADAWILAAILAALASALFIATPAGTVFC
jgi:hypothetical protein